MAPIPIRRTPARRTLAAAGAAATLLGALVIGGGAADATRSAPVTHHRSAHRIATALLALLNRERSAHHLRPLTSNVHLIRSAHAHDLAMAKANVLSHQLPKEPDLGTRETRAGYRWSWAGENIAWNSDMSKSGVLALERMMYAEKPPNDGHRLNILSTHYRNVGVDVHFDKAHHKVWLTTDFGRH